MIRVFIFIFSLILPILASADIYRYMDDKGRAYYSNITPKDSRFKKIMVTSCPSNIKALTKSQRIIIEKTIKDGLKDPYSAHFKWSKNFSSCYANIKTYCAFVNAKNSFGGYIGYTPFKVNLVKSKKGWAVDDVEMGNRVYCPQVDD
jgi:hypothetical protein